MNRKTFEVDTFKSWVNSQLAENDHMDTNNLYCGKSHRLGLIAALENLLHETGNYRGFNYLEQRGVPSGQKAGIIHDPTGGHDHEFPDDTRRVYL